MANARAAPKSSGLAGAARQGYDSEFVNSGSIATPSSSLSGGERKQCQSVRSESRDQQTVLLAGGNKTTSG